MLLLSVCIAIGLGPLLQRSELLLLVVQVLGGLYLIHLGLEAYRHRQEHADDMILYATLGIILGGRIGYILFYQPSILENPIDIFKLWEGGMSLHGGTLGTIFAIWLLARKYKLSFLREPLPCNPVGKTALRPLGAL